LEPCCVTCSRACAFRFLYLDCRAACFSLPASVLWY
jgi:hypothetical protein